MSARSNRRTAPVSSPSHLAFDVHGAASRMVDVGAKPVRARSAVARAQVVFPAGVLSQVLAGRGAKGAITEVARSAGILAAKRTGDLIPMCHPLGLDHVSIEIESRTEDVLEVRCSTACRGRTGVEMEALMGAAVAALTVYDMTKGLDHGIRIERIELLEKRGGRSGVWRSADAPSASAPRRSATRAPGRSPAAATTQPRKMTGRRKPSRPE